MDAFDQEAYTKLQELLKDVDPEKAPSRKDILNMVDSLDLSDEAKEKIKVMLVGDVPKVFGSYGGGTLLAVIFILVVFAMIFFFGYKLYKSIKDKEKKKEEKKKAKQSKKKK
ncbi:unnamed protein product [Arctia plantaginis]|uniref:Uncharacterized protein n=1 Tax=Arctia plantaginis TaxID=874455 RepID=A0A8S1AB23_ARCPL|nr:unnamed protein product [Arctia plantaginis]CAB3262042.1 unnamed protein product [Arctia plantaginis]